jgi:hypothetical protein
VAMENPSRSQPGSGTLKSEGPMKTYNFRIVVEPDGATWGHNKR